MAKIPKVTAGYLPLRYVGMDGTIGTSCSKCRDFISRTSECVILTDPKVSGPHGTCIIFIKGVAPPSAHPLALIPKSVVGYTEGPEVPTYCGRCEYYENQQSRTSVCEKVGDDDKDTVEYGACCNAYEAR